MPSEIITLQAGQCGNQIGAELWTKLCSEHGISDDGTLHDFVTEGHDRKDVFFHRSGNDRYVPRALLFDLEPRVLDTIKRSTYGNMFNHRNILTSPDGGGAGNLWPNGYSQAKTMSEPILDMLCNTTEASDSLEGFMLLHAVSGGTGSGLGSYILEQISDLYPKKLVQTYSVFPDSAEGADVVVQPYNTMLTLKRLKENADCVVVLDNKAMTRIVGNQLHNQTPIIDQANKLASTFMAAGTSTLRYPNYMYNDLCNIISSLVIIPKCHFLTAAYTPFISDDSRSLQALLHQPTEFDIMRSLLKRENWMISAKASKSNCYISALNIIQGEIRPAEISNSISRIAQLGLTPFIPWAPRNINIALSKKSQYLQTPYRVTGAMLFNHTSVATLLKKVLDSYEKLRKRGAFLDLYKKHALFAEALDEFDDCKTVVGDLIEEYKACEKEDYIYSRSL
ncbi:tubulin gamma chain [Backusella circina FSU 941]|nr:tubulin gamma chain [Backusella circina FSU 941]